MRKVELLPTRNSEAGYGPAYNWLVMQVVSNSLTLVEIGISPQALKLGYYDFFTGTVYYGRKGLQALNLSSL